MRFPKLLSALFFALALPAFAQVESNLATVTDLSDNYRQTATKNEAICIFDFTPTARAVYEPYEYLTTGGRNAFLGEVPNGQFSSSNYTSAVVSTLWSPYQATVRGKALGVVFGLRIAATGSNKGNPEVRLYWWPQQQIATATGAITDPNNGGGQIVGTPLRTKSDGTVEAIDKTMIDATNPLASTIAQTSFVRVTIYLSSGGKSPRTVDLPCPWKIWDSPTYIPSTAANYQRNQFSTTNSSGVTVSGRYDPWSEGFGSATTTSWAAPALPGVSSTIPTDATLQASHWVNGGVPALLPVDVVVGNFVYTPDYLAFIFGGKAQRYLDSSTAQISWTGLSTFVVPDSLTSTGAGWGSGLSNLTRYQGVKTAIITTYLSNTSGVNVYYRFLDPTNTFPATHEETKTPTDTSFGGPDNTTGTPITSLTNRTIRLMTTTNLVGETDILQARGPRNYDFIVPGAFTTFDSSSPDPNLSQPLNYVLADTYRQIANNEYGADRSSPCGKAFVLLFPGEGMNDSYSSPMASDAAHVTAPGNSSGNGNGGGSFSATNNSTSLFPTSASFFAPTISSIAAHATGGATGEWGQPWTFASGGTTVHIQTFTIAVGVPGAYHFKDSNSGKTSPHENLFFIPQWGDPARGTSTNPYSQSNGQPSNQDLPIQVLEQITNPTASVSSRAKVFYWVGSDPQSLAKAANSAFGFIVGASAALSAPATPATGVLSANSAYFGIFKTTLDPKASLQKSPLWSGNLFGMGVRISTEYIDPLNTAKGTHEVLSFYGYDGSGANGQNPNDVNGVPHFDQDHLWDSYDIFGKYNPTTLAPNSPSVHTTGLLYGSGAMLWYQRTLYTMVGGQRVAWPNYSPSSGSWTDTDNVFGQLTTRVQGINPATGAKTGTPITLAQAQAFAAWVRGAYNSGNLPDANNGVYNRQNIMGDIVNSAPLAVELTPSGADALLPSSVPANPFTGNQGTTGNKYFDPHARLIIVGTNTGQLECFFEWSASYYSGTVDAAGNKINFLDAKAQELWSFIPPDFWQVMYKLYVIQNDTTGTFSHLYMVDGDPGLYHVDKPPTNSSQGTLPDTRVSLGEDASVIFGNRKGSRSYYGLQISDAGKTIKPDKPVISWVLNPQDPAGTGVNGTGGTTASITLPGSQTAPTASQASLIETMGMGTSAPVIATVNSGNAASSLSTPPTVQDVVFLGGGYSNPEMDARYKNDSSSLYGQGMGRLVIGLDPLKGGIVKTWDLRNTTGAVAEGVTPVRMFPGDLSQRIYFADTLGSVWSINNIQSTVGSVNATNGYRIDSAFIGDWNAVRPIYKASANKDSNGNPENMRFTTRPDVFNLQGGFPTANSSDPDPNPVTVMVAIGSGDRNNPTDRDETYTIGSTTYTQHPPQLNRLMVFADRQDSQALGYDANTVSDSRKGIPDNNLTQIANNGTAPTSYSDPLLNPSNASYVLANDHKHNGYYMTLGQGTLSGNGWNGGITYDKILVSPLIKQGLLFFSIYDIANSGGFNCSANSFTRTFRECDILRPISLDLQTTDLSIVSDIQGNVSQNSNTCSGLAFYFNSISSQLVDAGTRVLQGGALTAGQSTGGTISTGTQASQNTPSIQSVKDTDVKKGIRVRAWRVVR